MIKSSVFYARKSKRVRFPPVMAKPDPASFSAPRALESDPFYRAITVEYAADAQRRLAVLSEYFTASINEARAIGRCVHDTDPAAGVAVWNLPQPTEVATSAGSEKRTALAKILGSRGLDNYDRIIAFMHPRAEKIVPAHAWYLSIVAIDPLQQGRGIGARLLAPTLAEADRNGVTCYLETFSPRNPSFYRRLGFDHVAQFREPTAAAEYAIMVRKPSASPLLAGRSASHGLLG